MGMFGALCSGNLGMSPTLRGLLLDTACLGEPFFLKLIV